MWMQLKFYCGRFHLLRSERRAPEKSRRFVGGGGYLRVADDGMPVRAMNRSSGRVPEMRGFKRPLPKVSVEEDPFGVQSMAIGNSLKWCLHFVLHSLVFLPDRKQA